MVKSKNIIKKVVFDIEMNDMDHAMDIKEKIGEHFVSKIVPILENQIEKEERITKYEVIEIDKIELILDLNSADFFTEFELEFLQNIKQYFSQNLYRNSEEIKVVKLDEKSQISVLNFLEKGYLNWWQNETDFDLILSINKLSESPKARKILQKSISQINTLNRLILNTDFKVLKELFIKFLDKSKSTIFAEFGEITGISTKVLRLQFWQLFFMGIQPGNPDESTKKIREFARQFITLNGDPKAMPPTLFKELVSVLHLAHKILGNQLGIVRFKNQKNQFRFSVFKSESRFRKNIGEIEKNLPSENCFVEISSQKLESTPSTTNEISPEFETFGDDGIIVSNAGLVILHPFLLKFLEKQQILKNGAIDHHKIDLAVHILHYLACKRENPIDYELIMEKFICNIPLDSPIDRFVTLNERQKDDCEELLKAVISHWETLKTKNTDVLRSEFLTRPGKLTTNDDRNLLQIECKTQDILLDKIPWTIGVFKLPWAKKLTYVEW